MKRKGQVCNFLNSIGKLLQGSGGPGFITPTYDESGRNAANFRAQLYRVKKASTRTKCATGKRIIGPLLFYIKVHHRAQKDSR